MAARHNVLICTNCYSNLMSVYMPIDEDELDMYCETCRKVTTFAPSGAALDKITSEEE